MATSSIPLITIQPLPQLWISKEHIILDYITSYNHKEDIHKSRHKLVQD